MKTTWIRFLVLALVLLLSRSSFAAEEWPKLPYTEVRAYAWPNDPDKRGERVILPGMKLRDDVINKDGAVLNPDQIKRLQAAITGDHPEHALMRCYSPHNAFIFYDADKKPVACVEICFDCLNASTLPDTAAKWKDLPALAKIFDDLKLPIGGSTPEAFSKRFESLKREKTKPR